MRVIYAPSMRPTNESRVVLREGEGVTERAAATKACVSLKRERERLRGKHRHRLVSQVVTVEIFHREIRIVPSERATRLIVLTASAAASRP